MGLDVPWHWVVLAVVALVLFGYKKLPDASRSVGRSLRIFKTELKGLSEDDKARESTGAPAVAPSPVAQVHPAGDQPAVIPDPAAPAPLPAPVEPSAEHSAEARPPTGGAG